MDRVTVFVDAGYLFAQGSILISGHRMARGQLLLDPRRAATALEILASHVSGLPLLRIYWYDGTSMGPTAQHVALARVPNLKVRLGYLNRAGEQKGVDSLIVTDMIALARNRAMADAILLSGDEDLRVGVQQAQEFGVKVHLLGLHPSRGSQSEFLLQEADSTHEWAAEQVSAFLSVRAQAPESVPPAPIGTSRHDETLLEIAKRVTSEMTREEFEAILGTMEATGWVPREIDAQLLAVASARLGAALDRAQRKTIRSAFRRACQSILRP